MEKFTKKELVKMGNETKPTIHIGKEGITDGIAEEVKTQLKNNKVIKVKMLPAAEMDIKEAGAELEERTGTKCVETRGFTILLTHARLFEEKKQ